MSNRKKVKSERKSEKICIRITPGEKKNLEQLAKVKELTLTEMVREMLTKITGDADWKSREMWKYIHVAGQIIDEHENSWRKGGLKDEARTTAGNRKIAG